MNLCVEAGLISAIRAKLLAYLGQLPPDSQRQILEWRPSLQGVVAEQGEPGLKAG
jgi:hypothetical protein